MTTPGPAVSQEFECADKTFCDKNCIEVEYTLTTELMTQDTSLTFANYHDRSCGRGYPAQRGVKLLFLESRRWLGDDACLV